MNVVTKKREIQINSDYIEAGELANEIGKIYMQDLDSAINDSRKLDIDKLYFIVQTEKDPTNLYNIEIRIGITNKYFDKLFESTDFWEYDYKREKKRLIWSIPHRIDMKNFLRAPHKYSKDIIQWIKDYLKQHPEINLQDKTQVILP